MSVIKTKIDLMILYINRNLCLKVIVNVFVIFLEVSHVATIDVNARETDRFFCLSHSSIHCQSKHHLSLSELCDVSTMMSIQTE